VPSPSLIRENFGAAFQFGEQGSALWAAASLTNSPCINRPTEYGFAGRYSASSAITEMRGGIDRLKPEIFSRNFLNSSNLSQPEWFIQDAITSDTVKTPSIPEGKGPYKSRLARHIDGYEIVVVVGNKASRITKASLNHLELERKSIRILDSLSLIFGTVTWSIDSKRGRADIARVDPFPPIEPIQCVGDLVSSELMRILFI
jgi:hypothetical protein